MKKPALLTLIMLLFGLVYWGCEDCPTCPDESQNHAPVINEILTSPSTFNDGDYILTAVATDKDGDTITYHWSCSGGEIRTGLSAYGITTNPAIWVSPDTAGTYTITCIVSDGKDTDSKSISITVT